MIRITFSIGAIWHHRWKAVKQQGEDDPTWVKLKPTALQWEKYTPVMGCQVNAAMTAWYSNPANRLTPFDPTAETKGDVTWIPKAPMLPTEVALNIAQNPTTPWELLEMLEKFLVDKDPQVGGSKDCCTLHFLARAWDVVPGGACRPAVGDGTTMV